MIPVFLFRNIMSLLIEIFSAPNCNTCSKSIDLLKKIIKELGEASITWRKINVLEDIDRAVALGVITTPAIVINNQLVISGLPSSDRLRQEIVKRLV